MAQGGDTQSRALLIDRDQGLLASLAAALRERRLAPVMVSRPHEALAAAERQYFEMVFLSADLGAETVSTLEAFLDAFPDTLVILFSRRPELSSAVSFMRMGAFHYLADPVDPAGVLTAADLALEFRSLREQGEGPASSGPPPGRYDVDNIIGSSRPMQDVFRLIHKVAATDATVLILGESGTGKELVARAIHHHSARREKPLVPVNCGAIPAELLESELFGHEKGSFTGAIKSRPGRFELADGGTVFLDEIGDMSSMLQVKLLRILQEHQFERVGGINTIAVNIRVIAATHRDLAARVAEGQFREDLYYRLNVVPIQVPPLRERRSDIPPLCEHFLHRLSQEKGLESKTLSAEVMDRLMRYTWPGNVRELENLLERMVILAEGEVITLEDLPPKMSELPGGSAGTAPELDCRPELPHEGVDFNAAVDAFERELILQALERTGWVKNQAAALLQLNRTTLVEKIKKKGLEQP